MRIICFILIMLCVGCKTTDMGKVDNSLGHLITYRQKQVSCYIDGLEHPFKVMFLADTHFTVEDRRGFEYYDYTKRMGGDAVKPENYGKSNGRELKLMESLHRAKSDSAELVVLGGDIINFPSLASVERLEEILEESGVDWRFVAGNHDWHYEGEPGTDDDARSKWEGTNLNRLYQGSHPLYTSVVLHGINFVLIDNSTFEISDEQLKFFKAELEKGLPVVLCVHIPLYLPGHDIDYGCGSPYWNKASDIYYEIERRLPWPEEGHSATTYEFRNLVFNHPQVIGVFAGHTHQLAIDFYNNKLQYVVGANYNGDDVTIHFLPKETGYKD